VRIGATARAGLIGSKIKAIFTKLYFVFYFIAPEKTKKI
jgi:hypothetical protein